MERHSFDRVSGESPETLRKLCLSTKFPHQGIKENYGILRSVLQASGTKINEATTTSSAIENHVKYH